MNQQVMMQAQALDNRMKELQQNIEFIDSQVLELDTFKTDISKFSKFNGSEIISSIGKGIHVPSHIKGTELLVEVGSGIVLKKTPEQAVDIVESQLSRIKTARLNILSEIDKTQTEFQSILLKLQQER
jgi:prefoldin alpha subunit